MTDEAKLHLESQNGKAACGKFDVETALRLEEVTCAACQNTELYKSLATPTENDEALS